ncbi:RIP metalloprotease RseP [candidate division KSB1 bacterium]|nr:RIP metalloprotease RseP [candidate division KSB1 bacterium]NIR69375.1 RIP metalloprotease RseP [candidate division KSB1 bacterium]NIS24193.1 RIP metalloprotease RseP [candidate division KSB1 bacterium]NIT71108.1 RIP metalloprotease RseP [candidate division KSB1 bacterium]NIU24812.1 RIP metalloprotease RseP [candidate division KSB1 bacterium]
MTSIISFIFVLGLLIFVHEFGHFITAKMVGIRVERFSLGFPPRMIGKKIGETDYCISWLPLGGYVKMAGMVDETMNTDIRGEPWEFQSKPIWQRVIVISAGSFMNILTAVVIYAMLVYFVGMVQGTEGTKVGEVLEGRPAEAIGLQQGDVITAVDGQPVSTWQELTEIIHSKPGTEIQIKWQRNGQTITKTVTPELQEEREIGLIGIAPELVYQKFGLIESFKYGVVNSYQTIAQILKALKLIVTGEIEFKEAIGGPITIFQLTGESAKRGIDTLLMFTAFISLNLGFFNLLPFPVLDGGHLVFLAIEGIRRKPLSVKTKVVIQQIGMAFLLALMIFVIFNDIRRWDQLKNLFP